MGTNAATSLPRSRVSSFFVSRQIANSITPSFLITHVSYRLGHADSAWQRWDVGYIFLDLGVMFNNQRFKLHRKHYYTFKRSMLDCLRRYLKLVIDMFRLCAQLCKVPPMLCNG